MYTTSQGRIRTMRRILILKDGEERRDLKRTDKHIREREKERRENGKRRKYCYRNANDRG